MRHLWTRRAVLLAGAGLAGCSRERIGFSGFAFIANHEGKAIAVVDMDAFAVARHVRLPDSPTNLISHPGKEAVYALTPASGTVHEISTARLERSRSLKVAGSAVQMHPSRDGESIWVLTHNELVELRLDGFGTRRRIALPTKPVWFDMSPKDEHAIVSFGDSGQAALVSFDDGRADVVECGKPIHQVLFRQDGDLWIAAHPEDKLLTLVDSASARVIVRLSLAVKPQRLCPKADGGQIFVTGDGADAVAIVYPYTTEVAETVLAGRAPGAMAASPASRTSPEYLFVTNPSSGHVTILEIESRRVVAAPQVGAEPNHVLITPDNTYALVLNQKSGDMAVILIPSQARRRRFPAALLTMIPVGSQPVSAVVQAV